MVPRSRTYIYIYNYIHTHIYIYIYICVCVCSGFRSRALSNYVLLVLNFGLPALDKPKLRNPTTAFRIYLDVLEPQIS